MKRKDNSQRDILKNVKAHASENLKSIIETFFDEEAAIKEITENTEYLKDTRYEATSRKWFKKEGINKLKVFDNKAFLKALITFIIDPKQGLYSKFDIHAELISIQNSENYIQIDIT
jgi:hypothetical protein